MGGGVGCQHHPAPPGPHAYHLQTHAMAAYVMHAQPLVDLLVARVKHHAAIIQMVSNHGARDYIVGCERKATCADGSCSVQCRTAFAGPGYDSGPSETSYMISRMIVMHVADDHIRNTSAGVDADALQSLAGTSQEIAASLFRHGFIEARVDHVDALARLHHPDKIIHGHGAFIMRVAPQKILPSRAAVMRVTERIRLPDSSAHILRLSYNVTL